MDSNEISLKNLFLSQKPYSFRKGEIILRTDLNSGEVYYIAKGHVNVYTISSNGDQRSYILYKAGEIFPIVNVFKRARQNLYYEAMDDTIIYKMPKKKFMDFIENKPAVLMDVINRIIDIHDVYVDRVDNLEYPNAYFRLIDGLLFLAKRFGKKKGSGVALEIPLTHQIIATTIAMTRETASREIEKLKKKKLVDKLEHLIIIKDLKKLEGELENSAIKLF